MPRGPRLDAPESLHHVMVRGLERRVLFRDDRDRADLLARLAAVVQRTGVTVLAWALLPNHFHLLVRSPPARPGPGVPSSQDTLGDIAGGTSASAILSRIGMSGS